MCFRRWQWGKGMWMWCPVIVRLPRPGLCVRHEPRRRQSRNAMRSVVHLRTFKFISQCFTWMLVNPPSGYGKGLCRTFTKSECFTDCGEGWVESTSLSLSIFSDFLWHLSRKWGCNGCQPDKRFQCPSGQFLYSSGLPFCMCRPNRADSYGVECRWLFFRCHSVLSNQRLTSWSRWRSWKSCLQSW